jgi:RimJ/RimL family protein N-acetyltransferase
MPGQFGVTLREVVGDPEELGALQRVMESDEDFALRVTGHPPGPADAQARSCSSPKASRPTTRWSSGCGLAGELVGVLDLLLRYPDQETVYVGLLLIDGRWQGRGVGAAACQALEREVLGRWPWVRRLRLSVVRTNEAILMDKPVAERHGSWPRPQTSPNRDGSR